MTELAELYPIRNCEYEVNDGLVTILFVNPRPSFIDRIFFKKLSKRPRKIDLDKIGSFVWELCDGANNVQQIIEKLSDHFGEEVDPADKRVNLFITQLKRNKFINLYMKNQENSSDSEK